MIDLHMHTVYSDGDKTVEEVLRMCEKRKLKYISITDHDTCKQYEDGALRDNKIFTGKIIIGTELHAVFQNKSIEILAYNVNTHIINEWCEKYYSEDKLKYQQEICRKRLFDICDNHGLIYDKSKIKEPEKASEYVERSIYEELLTHEENRKVLGEFTKSFNVFFRKGLANPESSYFMNHIEFRPKYKEVTDIIHAAGGKVFLAHPFEYELSDTTGFINELRQESELDGIECFHPSSEDDNKSDILAEYAGKNNLYISGGSDYHGDPKPDIEIGIGRGNLGIPEEIIGEWINQ